MVNEIRELRVNKQKPTANAERPLTSLGPIWAKIAKEKSEFQRLDNIVIEYNADGFFAKTFTIEHK